MKHTPGPWEVEVLFCGDYRIKNERRDRDYAIYQKLMEAERKANASLMEAAPKMYDACKFALNFLEMFFHDNDHSSDMKAVHDSLKEAIDTAEAHHV